MYCRDLPQTVNVTANDGRILELIAWQKDIGAPAFWYLTANGTGPIFVIFDTGAANAELTSFGSFDATSYSSGDEPGVGLGIVSSTIIGPDRPIVGSLKLLSDFKELMTPMLLQRLPKSVEKQPFDGKYTVSKGASPAIVGTAPNLVTQFLKAIVALVK